MKNEKLFSNVEQKTIEKITNNLTELNDDLLNLDFATKTVATLTELKMDFCTILSAYLYPLLKLEKITIEEIEKEYGPECAKMLSAITKIENINIHNKETQAESVKSMFIALAKDIRVIILLLAIQNTNLDNKEKLDTEQFMYRVKEVYSPLASMLGIGNIKNHFEDQLFRYYKPQAYTNLSKKVYKYVQERLEVLNKTKEKIQKEISGLIKNAIVYGRHKQLYSIYKKMQWKNLELNQVLDILALRIIVDTVEECYIALGKVHSLYKPLDHFKDYIAQPKENGYQSLHTTVVVENGDPLEIQIRTREMHQYAEYGFAAHFVYKEKRKANEADLKISYIRSIMDMAKDKSSEELLDVLKTDVYSGNIFVQTPLGKVMQFPEGSLPIDFAYAIHSNIGNKCVGAKINGKMCPLTTELNNGDIVEIITNQNSKGPSRDWLKIVKTNGAKNKINAFFKHEMKDENIKKGKSMLETYAKTQNVSLPSLMKDEWLDELFERYALSSLDDMYASIGYGGISCNQIINKLKNLQKESQKDSKEFEIKTTKVVNSTDDKINIKGFNNLLTKLANCCKPLPGDDIIGYISRGKGITIHRADCNVVHRLEKDRLIECGWNEKNNLTKFLGAITIICLNTSGAIAQISKKISDSKIDISNINTKILPDNMGKIDLVLSIENRQQLDDLVKKLKTFDFIIDVQRTK